MHIKAIIFSMVIGLAGAAAVASVQAAEGFTVLDGVAADRLSAQEMAAIQGTSHGNPPNSAPQANKAHKNCKPNC